MTTQNLLAMIRSIEWAIRETYQARHTPRRGRFLAIDEIRDYIHTLRQYRTALSLHQ
jgi:hypothetical protein